MASRFHVLVIASLLFGLLPVQTAHADPIAITSGGGTVPYDDPPFFNLVGDGFQLLSGFFGVPVSPQSTCLSSPNACAPGASINLSTVMGGGATNDLGQAQIAVVNGVTHATQSDFSTWLHLTGQFTFTAPNVMVPQLPSDPGVRVVSLAAPFVFHGQVAGAPQSAEGSPPLFLVDLVGQGTATLRLINDGDAWRYPEVHLTFEDVAPIPEPASILLLGSGLAGLLFRSRYNRRAGRAAGPPQ